VFNETFIKLIEINNRNINDEVLLDFASGCGLIGNSLKDRSCKIMIGVDVLDEAREASIRDYGKIYKDYLIIDPDDNVSESCLIKNSAASDRVLEEL